MAAPMSPRALPMNSFNFASSTLSLDALIRIIILSPSIPVRKTSEPRFKHRFPSGANRNRGNLTQRR